MGKKKHKNKIGLKMDDYYNDGLFEIARFGKLVTLKNLSTPEQHAEIMERYKQEYPKAKEQIDLKVQRIKNDISLCNPLRLLNFVKQMAMMSHLNKLSEIEYTNEENIVIRAQEYIQSILVSTENRFDETESIEAQEKRWHSVLKDIVDLYEGFNYFYLYWSAYKKDTDEITDEMIYNIVESQMLYFVRGNRYQKFELEPLKNLLPSHNGIIQDLFGITTEQIIFGLEKLQYSLSQALADAWNGIRRGYDSYCETVDLGETSYELSEYERDDLINLFENALGNALNDVSSVTGWNSRFTEALSLEVGENNYFFDDSEFSGWPIMEMPIKKKPFIKIDGISYAFDYYSLFDNFYRALQKEIFRLMPAYIDTWNKFQNLASENMVKDLFIKLLPGATVYTENYYPVNQSLKLKNENDIIIIYENYLFIIEVKAGSFPQTPPITDFDAHIKAYTKLAQEADSQCSRTIKYIDEHHPAIFYDATNQKKFEIQTPAEFKEVYSFSVTVDNFNAMAAKAEKLNFITLKSKTIVISYDDLLVYENYFDSPIYFLHFLKQRKLALDIPQIALNDELDHLGLYISHNMYSITAAEHPSDYRVGWNGYRQQLDEYFCALYHPEIRHVKPVQDMPLEIKEIILKLEQNIDKEKIELAHFLLDLSTDARDEFVVRIRQMLKRQREIGRMTVASALGEVNYCLFVSTPEIESISFEERQDYVLSIICSDESKKIMWINLNYDNSNTLIDVDGKYCSISDIRECDIERLKELNIIYTNSRLISYQQQNHKKLGRNDPCPCGSGKKYKKCCIDL